MSDNKEETNQVPTVEELKAAIELIPGVDEWIYSTHELHKNPEAGESRPLLRVKRVLSKDWSSDLACYVCVQSNANIPEHLLVVPEPTTIYPGELGYHFRAHFSFFIAKDDILEIRKKLYDDYVEHERVRPGFVVEIIHRRDALYGTLIFSSDIIHEALTELRSILAVPLVVSENLARDENTNNIRDFWRPISECWEDRFHCLLRIREWLASIDIPPVLKRGVTDGAQFWLDRRDAVLLGRSPEDVIYDWDTPGPQSAVVRHQLWWILESLAIAGLRDGRVQTELDETHVEQERATIKKSDTLGLEAHKTTIKIGKKLIRDRADLVERHGKYSPEVKVYDTEKYAMITTFTEEMAVHCCRSGTTVRRHLEITGCFARSIKQGKNDPDQTTTIIKKCTEYVEGIPSDISE